MYPSGYSPVRYREEHIPSFRRHDHVVKAHDCAVHDPVSVYFEDLVVHPFLDGLGESPHGVGETHVVSDDAIPRGHVIGLAGGEAFADGGLKVICLLYTSDAADDLTRVDLGGRRII